MAQLPINKLYIVRSSSSPYFTIARICSPAYAAQSSPYFTIARICSPACAAQSSPYFTIARICSPACAAQSFPSSLTSCAAKAHHVLLLLDSAYHCVQLKSELWVQTGSSLLPTLLVKFVKLSSEVTTFEKRKLFK